MYSRPTLSEIVQRVRADVLSRMNHNDVLRRADAEVLSRVLAGVSHGLYGYIDWLSKQFIYDTAEAEYLDRWCNIFGVPRKPASLATGTAIFTVQAGAAIPAGTTLQALDGQQYITTADAAIVGTVGTAAVAAVLAGAAGNRPAAEALSMISPVAGVQPSALSGAISGGADQESDDALRARLLAHIRTPPQGGSAADYEGWALSVPGVTRAWVYPAEMGVGTVTVRFVRDNDGTGAAIIPDSTEVAAVQAYIDQRRPVASETFVVAPVAVAQNFVFSGLTPNTAAVRAAVEAELKDLLIREAAPGVTLLNSHVRAAISAAAGEADYTLVAPIEDITTPPGMIRIFGTVTWN